MNYAPTENEIRRAIRRIKKTGSDFRFGKPDERDFVIDCFEAIGLDHHKHEAIRDSIAETVYLDHGERFYTERELARFVLYAIRQDIDNTVGPWSFAEEAS